MNNIVVPTDFSPHATHALKIAADICRKDKNCKLHLVHVYEKPISGLTMQFEIDNEKLRAIRAEINEKLAGVIEEHLQGITADKTAVADIAIKDILELDVMRDADLIVMGTHGVKGWKEFLLGSNAQRIVRNAHCPVLVIKNERKDFDLKNVLFVSDFLENMDTGFAKFQKLLDLYDPTIHLLKIADSEIDIDLDLADIDGMEDFIDNHNLVNTTSNFCPSSSIEKGVKKYVDKVSADCVIIETHGRGGLDRFMLGSVAEKMVNHLDQPVMTVKIS